VSYTISIQQLLHNSDWYLVGMSVGAESLHLTSSSYFSFHYYYKIKLKK